MTNTIGQDFYGYDHVLTLPGGISLFAGTLVSNLLMLAGLVLVFIIVYSGFSMVTGAGDPNQYAKAQQSLTAGIVGFIICVAAWFIVRVIESSTGVNILQK